MRVPRLQRPEVELAEAREQINVLKGAVIDLTGERDALALRLSEGTYPAWIAVAERLPECTGYHKPTYVLAVDVQGRMSIGYIAYQYSGGAGPHWTFAKNISKPTHWMPLPEAPK